ncbi:MAG: MATE family efflux transporter, partial [Frisingicoccus sp.]|nr:MATE family efflux transporter [Frisingicoccus sp.]
MKQDMTVGNPAKALIVFAIPMILGNLFQQLYSLVDSMIVGNFIGEEALAAVGSCFAVTMLFIAVAIGASTGASVIISQLFGAKRYQEMKKAISTALISFLAFSMVWAVFGLLIKDGLLHLL